MVNEPSVFEPLKFYCMSLLPCFIVFFFFFFFFFVVFVFVFFLGGGVFFFGVFFFFFLFLSFCFSYHDLSFGTLSLIIHLLLHYDASVYAPM